MDFNKISDGQRQGVPFVTGIIYENDIAYPIAKALAAQIICEAPYSSIGDEKLEEAKCWLKRCNNIICCRDRFCDCESGNQKPYNILTICASSQLLPLTAEMCLNPETVKAYMPQCPARQLC